MTIEEIRNACYAQPFQGFTVRMEDGRRIPVVKRECIGWGPLGYSVAVFAPDDRLHILDVAAIKELERNADVPVSDNDQVNDN